MSALPLTGVPGKMTRRLAAMTLFGQGLTIALGAMVARQLAVAFDDGESASTYLIGGLVFAVVALTAAGMMRRPWGITLGWVVQVLTFACAIVLMPMLVVGVIFTSIWVLSLTQGTKMDALTAQWHHENRENATDATDATAAGTTAENTTAEGEAR